MGVQSMSVHKDYIILLGEHATIAQKMVLLKCDLSGNEIWRSVIDADEVYGQ
jgi:hypothetical protein